MCIRDRNRNVDVCYNGTREDFKQIDSAITNIQCEFIILVPSNFGFTETNNEADKSVMFGPIYFGKFLVNLL